MGPSKVMTNRFSDAVFQAAAAAKERDTGARQSADSRESRRRNGVFSQGESMGAQFEFFFGAVIGTNALISGVEVQYRSIHLGEELPAAFVILRHAYTVLFLVELVARVYKLGFANFFCKGEVFWAWMDMLVVVMALIEMTMDVFLTASDQEEELPGVAVLRNVRLARLVRLTRAFRLHRIIRFIAALRMLVYSIAATLKSLLWAMVLLVMIIYVFGLAFTMQALDFVEKTDDLGQDEKATLTQEWGSLDVSMYTLFQSISGGVSWRDPSLPLQKISVVPTALFTVYIAFVYFAVLNVVTGVFCSSAVETTQRNPDLVAKSIIDDKRACTEKLQQLVGAIDDDESGRITIDELELIAEDDLMKAYFHALQIDLSDAYTLFKLIDDSNDGAIKLDDFLRGCEKLRGNATSMELAEMSYDMRRLSNQVTAVLRSLEKHGRSETDVLLKPSLEKLQST
jgi:Ca2+-binding EF-hand superfamily protein